ncbi:hypothetical protein [Candidatus Mesenet endosymbiont of Agriotes lineatus]|uniref:hypothetical protein n=1 Tax=Candidatus Mesenet endosymbiont of Agriotes lineatus TaxID=3077948 RepID=UPI0030D0B7AA
MSGTESSGGQSSKGFFHWLKNTWLGKLWNWIISCFRREQEDTEPQLTSYGKVQEGKINDNNGQSQSSEVERNEVNGSNITEEGKLDLTKYDSLLDNSHAKNRVRRKTRPPSIEKRHNDALSNSPSSQSESDDQADIGATDLEWEDEHNSDVTLLQGTSPQLQQKPGSSDTKGEKDNRQNTGKRKSNFETKGINGNSNTRNKGKRKEQVLGRKEEIDEKKKKKGEETLKKSEEEQKGAEERRNIANKQKKPSVKKQQKRSRSVSSDHSEHNGNSPSSSISRSNSSTSLSNGQGR